jgi:hypothetical protein
MTREQVARAERQGLYHRKIEAKSQECDILKGNLDAHKSHYFDREESGEAEYQGYSDAVDAYNDCLDKISALEEELKTAPVDFGTTDSGYEWPAEVPEPTGRPFVHEEPYIPDEPPPVASVDYSWPEEVPKPPEVVPEPEPPELVEQPPTSTASVDWRTAGCAPGTQRLVRGGMCVSSGLVSTALTMPTTTVPFSTQAMTTPSSAYLGRVRLARHPGAF